MANETASKIFVFCIFFWVIMIILGSWFNVQVTKTDLTNHDKGINVITGFSTMLKIMSFQYSEEVPAGLTLFLDAIFIITLASAALMARG